MFGADDRIEEHFKEPYQAWKLKPSPVTNAAMLDALAPSIEGAIRTHVGDPNPLLTSRARLMTLQSLRGYDPKRGRLQTHVYNSLLGLKRANRQQTQILRVPERVSLDRYHLDEATNSLGAELGRDPTDDELADHTGFSYKRIAKVRAYRPAVAEGTIEAATPSGVMGGGRPDHSAAWRQIIYDELDSHHRKVMELALGMHGRQPMANQEIARQLGKTPGAISQAKLRIQKLLDEQHQLDGIL